MAESCIEEALDIDSNGGRSPGRLTVHSDDSKNSDDNSRDTWNNYYDESDGEEDDSKFQIPLYAALDIGPNRSIEIMDYAPEIVYIPDETLEENNNDPNNNMDSIEMNVDETVDRFLSEATADRREHGRTSPLATVVRAISPQPGCSRNSQPVPMELPIVCESSDKDFLHEKANHIINLIKKIDSKSILEAIRKNLEVPVSQIKLWDLITDDQRNNYLTSIFDSSHKPRDLTCNFDDKKFSDFSTEIACQKILTTASSIAKRSRDVDICTVESKKLSSYPNPSIASTAVSSSSSLEIASIADVVVTPTKPSVNRGAIPKVRNQSRKQKDSSMENRSNGSQRSPVVSNTGDGLPGLKITRHKSIPNSKLKSQFKTQLSSESRLDTDSQFVANSQSNLNSQSMKKKPQPTQIASVNSTLSLPLTPPDDADDITKGSNVARAPFLKYPVRKPVGTRTNVHEIDRSNKIGFKPIAIPSQRTKRNNDEERFVAPVRARHDRETIVAPVRAHHDRETIVVRRTNPIPLQLPTADLAEALQQQQQPIRNDVETQRSVAIPGNQQNAKRKICMEMYYKLINIFPNANREYVKNLCPPEWGTGDHDAQLAPIVEHLLSCGDDLPPIANDEPDVENYLDVIRVHDTDVIYENLLGIFPDADPHYLRDFATKNVDDDEAVKTFVETNLEKRDYPTREKYMDRIKINEKQKQYTTGFNVKHFLSTIPNPTKEFMDPDRRCKHNPVAIEFLRNRYLRNKVTTITNTYDRCGFNLSLAADSLERFGHDLPTKRMITPIHTEDIALVQEMAFINHKTEINDYLENLKRNEDREYTMLKEWNQLFECQCCYDKECIPSKCSSCENDHIFCNSCIVDAVNAKLSEGETRIHCFVDCGSEFKLADLQQILRPDVFSILLKKRQAAEVFEAGVEGLESCPFCHFASIPPEGDKIFKCLNPGCAKESCRQCKKPSHVPLRCEETAEVVDARRFIEEKMSAAMIRKCYKCPRSFIKEEGCNKMTCVCGAMMCYLCDKAAVDYRHFGGQGYANARLCPLWSDTKTLDAAAVRIIGEEARAAVMNRNPNINIDTTHLLPDIPQAQSAAYTATELAERTKQILSQPM